MMPLHFPRGNWEGRQIRKRGRKKGIIKPYYSWWIIIDDALENAPHEFKSAWMWLESRNV